MTRRLPFAAFAAAALTLIAPRAQAQTNHDHIGLHVVYNTTFQDAGLGAQFSLPIARHLELYPSVDVYFQSGITLWQPNIDFKYRALGERADWFYIGTGLGLLQESFEGFNDDRAVWNLFAGVESIRGNIHPFAEARWGVSNITRFQIQGGLNITIGR